MTFETLQFIAEEGGYTVYRKQKARSWVVVRTPSGGKLYFRSYQEVAAHIKRENEYFDSMLEDKMID